MTKNYPREFDDERIGQFEAQMIAGHWRPQKDLLGNIHSWAHTLSEKTVKHNDAVSYWNMSGQTPVPF